LFVLAVTELAGTPAFSRDLEHLMRPPNAHIDLAMLCLALARTLVLVNIYALISSTSETAAHNN
jgi:hypothetical protein